MIPGTKSSLFLTLTGFDGSSNGHDGNSPAGIQVTPGTKSSFCGSDFFGHVGRGLHVTPGTRSSSLLTVSEFVSVGSLYGHGGNCLQP